MPAQNQPATATVEPEQKPAEKPHTKPRKLPPYNVILLDDNDHTSPYVIEMLGRKEKREERSDPLL